MATATMEADQGSEEEQIGKRRTWPSVEVDVTRITCELNPREHFDGEKLAALAATIRTSGLIQPIVVRPHPKDHDRYQLLAGGRRLKAAEVAGLATIRCEIRDGVTDAEAPRIYAWLRGIQMPDNASRRSKRSRTRSLEAL